MYGRYDTYNFSTDETFALIKCGDFSNCFNNNTEKLKILAIDSFITIWLLTLPEKFKEWFDNCNKDSLNATTVMSHTEEPSFPVFQKAKTYTLLSKNPITSSWKLLPKSWNLLDSFKHFFDQNEKWSTKSIEAE